MRQKVVCIPQKEASGKQWWQVNKTTCKVRGGLTVVVKVPTANGVCEEFKAQDGGFQAVGTTLVDRFQSALVAHCYCGTFFKDVGHLTDGPPAQQFFEGTYKYPPDLDQATRLLFEEATFTYEALLPTEVATYITAEDFQHY
jgi:hypothetical protein